MQPTDDVVVAGIGARSPLGLHALQHALCLRAAKLDPRPCPVEDSAGRRVGVSRMAALPDDLHGLERFVALGAPALREAACALGGAAVPLVLALPDELRPDQSPAFAEELVRALDRASGLAGFADGTTAVRADSAGFAVALVRALELVAEGAPLVLVGAIDSFYDPAVLRWLDDDRRLFTADNEEGIIPSEAAGFVLLARESSKLRVAPYARLLAVGVRREQSLETGEPNIGAAMAEVVREVMARAGLTKVDWLLSDVTGEHHRLSEWSKVELRLGALLAGSARNVFESELGHVGAATGAASFVTACAFGRLGCAPAAQALITLSSEGLERGAIAVGGLS